jgi:hypothetical protein
MLPRARRAWPLRATGRTAVFPHAAQRRGYPPGSGPTQLRKPRVKAIVQVASSDLIGLRGKRRPLRDDAFYKPRPDGTCI